jgi:hypothetical protein
MSAVSDNNNLRAIACNILTDGLESTGSTESTLSRIKSGPNGAQAWEMFNDTKLSTELLAQMAENSLTARLNRIASATEFGQGKTSARDRFIELQSVRMELQALKSKVYDSTPPPPFPPGVKESPSPNPQSVSVYLNQSEANVGILPAAVLAWRDGQTTTVSCGAAFAQSAGRGTAAVPTWSAGRGTAAVPTCAGRGTAAVPAWSAGRGTAAVPTWSAGRGTAVSGGAAIPSRKRKWAIVVRVRKGRQITAISS